MDDEAPQRKPLVTLSSGGFPRSGLWEKCKCFRKRSQIKPLGKRGQERRKPPKRCHNQAEIHTGNSGSVLQRVVGTHLSGSPRAVSMRAVCWSLRVDALRSSGHEYVKGLGGDKEATGRRDWERWS